MTLSLALSYSGRRDLAMAARALARRAMQGEIVPEAVDERTLAALMTTSGLPDVDLLVRTGGEQRLSDFLLFESSYAELYFADILWPDFKSSDLRKAFEAYAGRERRFGRTGDQLRTR